jgi:hypothetical protein
MRIIKKFRSKAMFSLITLFFIIYFILIILTINFNYQKYYNNKNIFTTTNILDAKKEINILNIEQIIKNTLKKDNDNIYTLKEEVDLEIYNYIKNSNYKWYLENTITNKKEELTLQKLNNLTKLIIFKPNQHLVIKKYIITNSVNKNILLNLEVENKKISSKYTFPKNYYVIEYVYK